MRKMVVIMILLLAGSVGAALSSWIASAVSGTLGTPYQVFGPVGLTVLGLGFVGGLGAPLLWSIMGVGFGNPECTNGCTELERWSHATLMAIALGTLLGIAVFAAENPHVSPISLRILAYLATFITVAEGAMVLGRGFNWILGSVSRRG